MLIWSENLTTCNCSCPETHTRTQKQCATCLLVCVFCTELLPDQRSDILWRKACWHQSLKCFITNEACQPNQRGWVKVKLSAKCSIDRGGERITQPWLVFYWQSVSFWWGIKENLTKKRVCCLIFSLPQWVSCNVCICTQGRTTFWLHVLHRYLQISH